MFSGAPSARACPATCSRSISWSSIGCPSPPTASSTARHSKNDPGNLRAGPKPAARLALCWKRRSPVHFARYSRWKPARRSASTTTSSTSGALSARRAAGRSARERARYPHAPRCSLRGSDRARSGRAPPELRWLRSKPDLADPRNDVPRTLPDRRCPPLPRAGPESGGQVLGVRRVHGGASSLSSTKTPPPTQPPPWPRNTSNSSVASSRSGPTTSAASRLVESWSTRWPNSCGHRAKT